MTGPIPVRGSLHSAAQSSLWRRLVRDPRAIVGAVAVLAVLAFALLGPLFASYPPGDFVAPLFQRPSDAHLLGTDVLGRDVLSRLLTGGRTFLLQGLLATLLGVGAGVLIGVAFNLVPPAASRAFLFLNDTVMVIPQILLVLIIISAFGATPVTLTAAVAVAQVTYTARLANAATKRVIGQDHVRAAQALGASRTRVALTEVLPNIAAPVLVEFGVRLSVSFVAMASLSYLGFGGSGPEWGRMIQENQGGILLQPFAALTPVVVIGVFLIGMNMLRDGFAKANAGRTAR